MTERKPHRAAFLFGAVVAPGIALTIIAVIGGVTAGLYLGAWAAAVVGVLWLVLAGLLWADAVARCRKAHYRLDADRIVIRGGGLFSDAELEVNYPKVTHVKWVRPWLSYKLFCVGHVYVEVAGGEAESIVFYCIADSETAQAEIRTHMEHHFAMTTDELLHEEQPSAVAIVMDIVLSGGWTVIASIAAIAWEVAPMLGDLAEGELVWRSEYTVWLLFGIPVLGVIAAIGILRYCDLKQRIYRVYRGVIEHHEGFLTRTDAFMPVENLSDSEVTRGIVQRLANAYNVVLSCQGAGGEVTFLHLLRGPELGAVLDALITSDRREQSSVTAANAETDAVQASARQGLLPEAEDACAEPSAVVPPPLPAASVPDLSYRMNPVRAILPLIPGILIWVPLCFISPVFIFLGYSFAVQITRIFRTTYRLRRNSVGEKFDFVRVRQREFSMDKVTGVVFRENLLDRILGTITVQFWSIGAGKEIAFANVDKSDELVAAVRQRAGVDFDAPRQSIAAEHSLGRFLCGNLVGLLFAAVLVVTLAVLAVLLKWVYALAIIPIAALPVVVYVWGVFHYRRSRLDLYAEGMCFRRGLVILRQTYARYHNVKDVTTVKMPGFDCGSMRFNVAGERVLKKQGGAAIPYGFTMHYVPEILSRNDHFDYEILAESDRPAAGTAICEARKALPNTAVRLTIVSIILLPLAALLPITLPIILYRTSLVRYRLEPGRVLMRRGRLFLSQTSILFSRIDHFQTNEGMLNKVFKNGNVQISTAGSSSAELVLRDVKNHGAFYEALHQAHRTPGAEPIPTAETAAAPDEA